MLGASVLRRILPVLLATLVAASGLSLSTGGSAGEADRKTYIVLLDGAQDSQGRFSPRAGAANDPVARITGDGGTTVVADLSRQIGVLIVSSNDPGFIAAGVLDRGVEAIAEDFAWQGFEPGPGINSMSVEGGGQDDRQRSAGQPSRDPMQDQQWSMALIRTENAHQITRGKRSIEVGVLDSGIDASHPDFDGPNGGNVDVERGRDFSEENSGPGVDNSNHGTHVAGIIAAQRNGVGIVGVAPNVTLVPVKVCEGDGFCFFQNVLEGITYAGDARLDIINMSFAVDDEPPNGSHEFKCRDDSQQLTYIKAIQRAINYARGRGVIPVAALGNHNVNLARPPSGPDCGLIPAETVGVIGVAAIGPSSQRASYSNGGKPYTDLAAPGGNGLSGDCTRTILSTVPGGGYGCLAGTSFAAPHVSGVVALILSKFGDRFAFSELQRRLKANSIDIGAEGNDKCFGRGRVDAMRAVRNTQRPRHEPASCGVPFSNQ